MSTGEITIKYEGQRRDKQDPMSQDYFGVMEITIDGRSITKNVSHRNTAALEEILCEIIEHIPRDQDV